MSSTRREFLSISSLAALSATGLGFPVPIKPGIVLPPATASDAPLPLPEGAIRRLGSRRLRTSRGISRVQFSAHGKSIVAADSNEIRAWSLATGQPVLSMKYPEQSDLKAGRVTSVDTIVALASTNDGGNFEILHFPFATGRVGTRVRTTVKAMDASAFAADGSRVATVTTGRLTMHHGLEARQLWDTPFATSQNNRTTEVVFVAADKLLAVTAPEGVRLFETDTGKERETLKSEPRGKKGKTAIAAVDGICASPDGSFLAGIGGANRDKILIWKPDTGELVQTIEGKNSGAIIGFLPDGKTLFLHRDAGITVIDVATKKVLRTLDLGPNRAPQLCPDGSCFAMDADDAVLFFDAVTGQPLSLSADPPGQPKKLFYAGPDSIMGLLTDYGGWVQWDLKTGSSRLLRPKTLGDGVPVAISADARTAIVTGKDQLLRYDLVSGRDLPGLSMPSQRSTPVADVSRDGSHVVIAASAKLTVWNTRTGQQSAIDTPGNRDLSNAIALAEDGDTVALGVQMGDGELSTPQLEIYSLRAAALVQRFAWTQPVANLALSPDGSRIAVSANAHDNRRGQQQIVSVYDTRGGGLLLKTPPIDSQSRAYALSPNNALLAIATGTALTIWEIASSGKRLTFKLPGDVSSMAFAPDGATLATAGNGGPVLIWDLHGGWQSKPAKPDATACGKLLDWLSDNDAVTAYEAIRLVAAWPEITLPLLAKALPPVKPPDDEKIKAALELLDAPAYRDRDKAAQELVALGELATPRLRATLAETSSAEVRERIEAILSRVGPVGGDLRTLRAVEAAEWAGTVGAKELLKAWAGGAAGARLTNDAAGVLRRMKW